MVSSYGSFNGDMQPATEISHALVHKKPKSDRDLLALVQGVRRFCWQLKEWEECRQIDQLYEKIEKKTNIAWWEEESELVVHLQRMAAWTKELRLGRTTPNLSEPLLGMNLSLEMQRFYLRHLKYCCALTAYHFYMLHKEQLDSIANRQKRPIPLFNQNGRPIESKDDLMLPQWTHLLRRLSDTKELPQDMVTQPESFCRDIQLVDEVHHAVAKNKEKSDRDILALVQHSRTFCWQLKDWDRCTLLDELYAEVRADINRKVKERHDDDTDNEDEDKNESEDEI
ncbi:hypothetical protein K440DRAFT_658360 [Wilcoxina mikolae CBS 423.85]|nr:hypothetical protein K440DRAFT_658360 [Wilcoxina mikolae CBS 423.85]